MQKGQTNSGLIIAAIIGAIGVIAAAYVAGTNNPKSITDDALVTAIAIQKTQVALADQQTKLQATVVAGSDDEARNAQATQQVIQDERNKLEQQLTAVAAKPEIYPPKTAVIATRQKPVVVGVTATSNGVASIGQIAPIATGIPKPQAQRGVDCSIGKPLPHHQPIVGQPWILPDGGWIIVNFWSNEPGIDQTEHKILLGPSSPRAFFGGGSAWQWTETCESVARQNLLSNPHPEITLEELRSLGLVR
jgi:hypothetical protein